MVGHEHFNGCCALAPYASYHHLAPLAGLRKSPPASSTAEFMATGLRDKTIRLWDARGTCLRTLISHDNWVRALVFHPGGIFLFLVSDDKTLRCWDLNQEGKCVKMLRDAHERFFTCLRWTPGIIKDVAVVYGGDLERQNGEGDGTPKRKGIGVGTLDVQIRYVIAIGGVDFKLRIFAS